MWEGDKGIWRKPTSDIYILKNGSQEQKQKLEGIDFETGDESESGH
jgi:hypothetical protein